VRTKYLVQVTQLENTPCVSGVGGLRCRRPKAGEQAGETSLVGMGNRFLKVLGKLPKFYFSNKTPVGWGGQHRGMQAGQNSKNKRGKKTRGKKDSQNQKKKKKKKKRTEKKKWYY